MLGKVTGNPMQPNRQGRVIEVRFRGKMYKVLSKKQFEDVTQITKLELLTKGVPAEVVDSKAIEVVEEKGFSTMALLLGRATPEEKEEITNLYRFGGIWRSNP